MRGPSRGRLTAAGKNDWDGRVVSSLFALYVLRGYGARALADRRLDSFDAVLAAAAAFHVPGVDLVESNFDAQVLGDSLTLRDGTRVAGVANGEGRVRLGADAPSVSSARTRRAEARRGASHSARSRWPFS